MIGIHPEAGKDQNDYKQVEELLLKNREHIVGIGEIGLDYYYEDLTSRENQIGSFENQIRLAIKYNLPVVIHIRDKENEFQNLSRCLWYFKKIPEYKSDASYFCKAISNELRSLWNFQIYFFHLVA
ncbi:TatD family hydrolase [Mycoplasmopsis cynos]|nr:TatD family hydrolase [Mycoplasmopsis cynos]